jgi:hypothetical protein
MSSDVGPVTATPAGKGIGESAERGGVPGIASWNGRSEYPRKTRTAWDAVRSLVLATPITADAGLGVRLRAQAGPAAGVQIGVAADHQLAQPAQIAQDRAQRRDLAPAELTRPVGRYLGDHRGAVGQHVRKAASTAGARASPVLR